MSLSTGARLGAYEILGPLGAGGMGEVYRARDSKLDRDVAIKVLPEAVSADRDMLARFEREAKAVAALNHPNILSIHDFGNHDGISFAVMELLEGGDLRSRLDGGALPQRKAAEIAVQIARGLAAAHEKGIVHRDLKPENIFLTSDGRVKILDFGLAKVVSREAPQSAAPTAPAGTEPGTVMGTVGYMSPEQVRGRELDARTDIFSFGAILYEMLSGKRAFARDSSVETMNAILKEEPPELLESGRNISPEVDRIVRHCLEKTPEARFHSAGDVAFALESISGSGSRFASTTLAPARSALRRRPAILAAVVAAAVAAGIFLDRGIRSSPALPTFEKLTSRRGSVDRARFSADGKTVVYSAQWEGKPVELFTVTSAGQESRSLDLREAMLLSISSGDELALKLRPRLWTGQLQGTLARVPLSGGSPRELRENVLDADWIPGGRGLALARLVSNLTFSIEFSEGRAIHEEHNLVRCLRVSPDGKRIAVFSGGVAAVLPNTLSVVDSGGATRVLSHDEASGLAWDRSGKEIWLTTDATAGGSDLWSIDLEGRRRLIYRAPGSVALQDISRSGDVLVRLVRQQMSVMYRGPETLRESDLAWHDTSRVAAISPDGRSVLLSEGEFLGPGDSIYLRRTDGSPAIQLGEGIASDFSPDGKWVLAQEKGSKNTFLLVPTGAGAPRKITVPTDISEGWFFPDGRHLFVSGLLPNGKTRIYSVDLDGKDYRQIAPDGFDGYIGQMPISPDGKSVALNGTSEGSGGLSIFPTQGGTARDVPGYENDDVAIRWAADGNSMFVFKRNEVPARVFRLDTVTGKRTPWLELMPADSAGVTRISSIEMSADGKSYAYNFTRELSDLYLIRGLR